MFSAFLDRMAATPFVDGQTDCILTPADWVVLNGWPDPAADLRGRYSTALGRERLLRRLGGLEAVVTERMAAAGLNETEAPEPGDVGLIEHGGLMFGAIRQRRLWAVQSSRGVLSLSPHRVIKAWSIANG